MPKNDLVKPRGKMSAYAFFVQMCREEHKRKHPEVVFTEFSRKCADRWKTMSDFEKKRFNMLADCDSRRFETEIASYNKSKGNGGKEKSKKKVKDPNAPKGAISAFFFFSNEERPKIKIANPELGITDIAKEIGRRWADIDASKKSKFEKMAEDDKIRYEKEKRAYEEKKEENNGKIHQDESISDSE